MRDERRSVGLTFHIDTNRVNSRSALASMNKLEAWHADGTIMLQMSEAAQAEASADRHPARTKKARSYIYTRTLSRTPEEHARMRQIEQILFPSGAKTPSENRDVEIVFNAGKYHAILVTNDGGSRSQPGGILGNRGRLTQLGIRVMTDAEAVTTVEHKICARDERIAQQWRATGDRPPE